MTLIPNYSYIEKYIKFLDHIDFFFLEKKKKGKLQFTYL